MNHFIADIGDELAAGRDFPNRQVIENGELIRWDHARAAAYLDDVRSFWIAAADGYLRTAELGCSESIRDARDALAKAFAVHPSLRSRLDAAAAPF